MITNDQIQDEMKSTSKGVNPIEISKSNSLTEKSINSLLWFYTIILSLAIVKVITQFISLQDNSLKIESDFIFNFIVFMLLAIPFHQGANQYLYTAYLAKESYVKKWTGIIDFLFFFIEGMLFYGMAILFLNNKLFYYACIVLLTFDIVWILSVRLTNKKLFKKVIKWLIINSVAVILIFPILYFECLNESLRYIYVAIILILRTIVDYIVQNPFYWPSFDSVVKN
jgi:hypothetical protein